MTKPERNQNVEIRTRKGWLRFEVQSRFEEEKEEDRRRVLKMGPGWIRFGSWKGRIDRAGRKIADAA